MPHKSSKILHLIRHAKSSWSNPDLADIDRPLNSRGQRACQLMAEPIFSAGCDFAATFCSPAQRARMTVEGLNNGLSNCNIVPQVDEKLYTFYYKSLLAWCRQLPDDTTQPVIIGHNPALTDFYNFLTKDYLENLPTCGYLQIALDIDSWRDLAAGCGELVTLITPKMLS